MQLCHCVTVSQRELLGEGPCKSRVDVETRDAQPFLYIMDGIQKAGAEAWVRIEEAGDEQIIRTAMEKLGLKTDKMRFFVAPGNTFWYRDCGLDISREIMQFLHYHPLSSRDEADIHRPV